MSQIEKEVDKLRDEFESSTEWQLRREFLLANYDSLPPERLVCMSRVFVNVEQYGCLYPDAVMKQLRELSEGVMHKLEECKERRFEQMKARHPTIKFVPASGSGDPFSSSFTPVHSKTLPTNSDVKTDSSSRTLSPGKKTKIPDSCCSPEPDQDEHSLTSSSFLACSSSDTASRQSLLELQLKHLANLRTSDEHDDAPSKKLLKLRDDSDSMVGKDSHTEALKSTPVGFSASSSNSESKYRGIARSTESTPMDKNQQTEVPKSTPVGFSASSSNPAESKYIGFVRSSESLPMGKNQQTEAPKSTPAASSHPTKPKYTGFVRSCESKPNMPTSSAGSSGPGFWKKPTDSDLDSKNYFQTGSSSREAQLLQDEFKQLANNIETRLQKRPEMTPVELVHQAAEACKLKNITCKFRELGDSGNPLFQGELKIAKVLIASHKATNKKVTKHQTYAAAVRKFLSKKFSVVWSSSEDSWELQGPEAADVKLKIPMASKVGHPPLPSSAQGSGSGSGQDSQKNKSSGSQQQQKPSQPINFAPNFEQPFFLVENLNAGNPVYKMQQSADFCKAKLEFRCEQRDGENWSLMWLNGQLLGEAKGRTSQLAKIAAAGMGFSMLQNHCWTVQIKSIADAKEGSVSKFEILGKRSAEDAIPEDNKGSIMLRKMGWTGGGVGKAGTGIATPIEVSTVLNRSGLGLSAEAGVAQDFTAKIAEVVRVYAGSERQDDLVLSSDFTKVERAIIHAQCKRYGLRSKSQGKKHSRCLVVSRKRTIYQLLQHLIEHGGVTDKYELVPPKPVQEMLKLHRGSQQGLDANMAWEDSLALCQQIASWGAGGEGSNATAWLMQQWRQQQQQQQQASSSTSGQGSGQQESWPGGGSQGRPSQHQAFHRGSGPGSSTWSPHRQQPLAPGHGGQQQALQGGGNRDNAGWQAPMQGLAQGLFGSSQAPDQSASRGRSPDGPQGWNAGSLNSGASGGGSGAGMSGYWGSRGSQQGQQGWSSRADGRGNSWQQQRSQRETHGNMFGGQGNWQGGASAGLGFRENSKQ